MLTTILRPPLQDNANAQQPSPWEGPAAGFQVFTGPGIMRNGPLGGGGGAAGEVGIDDGRPPMQPRLSECVLLRLCFLSASLLTDYSPILLLKQMPTPM